MRLHNLKNTVPRPKRKRVGRGNGNNWGRSSGRGDKGQMSRAGANHRPYFEGGQIPLLRRLPKRGFNQPQHKVWTVVNVGELEEAFEAGATVDTAGLQERGMIGRRLGAGLKILGDGELTKALTIKANKFSGSAMEKVAAAGGSCEVV